MTEDRVLVTGAAGVIGTAVLDRLAADGVPATALVLDEPPPIRADRVVVGDAGDPDVVADALGGVTAVIHLAAIANPLNDPDHVVFGRNTRATFAVLDGAGRAGVRRAAIASSYSVCGLPFARVPTRMPYLPVDVRMPLQITDPYALSKQVDEATAAMVHRRYGIEVVALRLPFVGSAEKLAGLAGWYATEPGQGASDVWSYLDVRDAARALVAALRPAGPGNHVLYLAAPETLSARPTEWLLDRFHPDVPRPSFPGRAVPIDLSPARDLLGFEAVFPFPIS
ncbi:NAD-dependent epimerase/dehydratase family protein [Paractinoplanes rishiriensis]|uniref:NAD-dependent epimerase/dehydratase family protein n=1 Tax=Paractinoplanes rishiriensis TaxID=1050105 RepID=UPI001EF2B5DD|nr:NAD(P)-dependent oxidoreductase [Actinoplanes rishiriensis]